MKKLIRILFIVILALFIISVATSLFAQTSNKEFNEFVIANGGDYSYQGNTIAVQNYNFRNNTSYNTMWEIYVAISKVSVIKSPLQHSMTSIKNSTIANIFDIPATRVDNISSIKSIDSITTNLTFRPIVIKKAKISFGDTLVLGNRPNIPNIIKHKNIIVENDDFYKDLKQGKWLRIKSYHFVRVKSKPDFSIKHKSNKTPKRAGIYKSLFEGGCHRKKGDGFTLLSLIIVILLYFGSKDYKKRRKECDIMEYQWYYES